MEITWISDSLATEATLLVFAFVLSGLIGLEREVRQKTAGARTHILVGLGSALFTLVSAYGFDHVLGDDVVLDPSRIAAQIVTGIGFLGAGVIFVRRTIISGLTTAASIWVTAAVGMACGAGMPLIAALAVGLHLLTVTVLHVAVRRLPHRDLTRLCTVRYQDGRGVLRDVLATASELGFEASLTRTRRLDGADGAGREHDDGGRDRDGGASRAVEATMRFSRPQHTGGDALFERLAELDGVLEVRQISDDEEE